MCEELKPTGAAPSRPYPVSASEALAKRLDDADFVLIRNCPMVTKFDHENVDAILTGEEHNLIVTALRTGGVAQCSPDCGAKAYVERAIASYIGDPADNQFQKGFLAALEVVRDEAFPCALSSTDRRTPFGCDPEKCTYPRCTCSVTSPESK